MARLSVYVQMQGDPKPETCQSVLNESAHADRPTAGTIWTDSNPAQLNSVRRRFCIAGPLIATPDVPSNRISNYDILGGVATVRPGTNIYLFNGRSIFPIPS